MLKPTLYIDITLYASDEFTFELLDIKEVEAFLNDTKEYQFKSCSPIDIYNQRELLYKKLKNYNFKICNFIYDLIPILFPHFMHEKTKRTFLPYQAQTSSLHQLPKKKNTKTY